MPADLIHLVRHGEVHNPDGVLYGRIEGYHLSDRGHRMAELAAASLDGHPITGLWASPLQRTQESAAPWAARFGLEIVNDERLIEPPNVFEGFNIRRELRRNPLAAAAPAQPVAPVLGRAVRLDPRPDDGGRRRHPRGHRERRGRHRQPPAADLDGRPHRAGQAARDRPAPPALLALEHHDDRAGSGDRFVEVDYQEPARELLAESIDLGAV